MSRIKPPTPPYCGKGTHHIEHNGMFVCNIWCFDEEGARKIETQYKTAEGIMAVRGVSRATAYRLIKRQAKRYWLTDLRDPDKPTVRSVLPMDIVTNATVNPVGNPNLHNGIYQQGIARRPRRK